MEIMYLELDLIVKLHLFKGINELRKRFVCVLFLLKILFGPFPKNIYREKHACGKILAEKRCNMYLISACLVGVNCKYNGGNNFNEKAFRLVKER